MYAYARNKNESPQWGSCRVYSIGNRVLCVCRGEKERQRKRMWGTSASLYCWSLPHFSLLSLLYHPFFPFPVSKSPFLSLLRRGLVSPWPVGTEKQPQWLEDCSSTITRGRFSSPGSTEMTLGMFHTMIVLNFGGASCQWEGHDPVKGGQVGIDSDGMREDYVPLCS